MVVTGSMMGVPNTGKVLSLGMMRHANSPSVYSNSMSWLSDFHGKSLGHTLIWTAVNLHVASARHRLWRKEGSGIWRYSA